MMKSLTWSPACVGVGLIAGILCLAGATPVEGQGYRAFIIRGNALSAFDTVDFAASPSSRAPIAGLMEGDGLVGIDIRPQSGFLYGLGVNSGTGTARLYAISYRTAFAAPIGATGTFVAADGATRVPVLGASFDIDFDPTTDRLRIVNDAGQNLRIDPNTGVFVDGDLGGPPGTVPGLNMDAPIDGAAAGLSAAAYTNNTQNALITTRHKRVDVVQVPGWRDLPDAGVARLNINIADEFFTPVSQPFDLLERKRRHLAAGTNALAARLPCSPVHGFVSTTPVRHTRRDL